MAKGIRIVTMKVPGTVRTVPRMAPALMRSLALMRLRLVLAFAPVALGDSGDAPTGPCTASCAGCAPVSRRHSTMSPARDVARRTAELAISHCGQSLDWLEEVTGVMRDSQLQLERVIVYLKCGDGAFSIPSSAQASLSGLIRTTTLPNVGRCDHTWAYHLATFYSNLADFVFFVKDSTFDNPYRRLAGLTRSPGMAISDVVRLGFGCFRRTILKGRGHGLEGRLHLRRKVFDMRMSKYRGHTTTAGRAAARPAR